MLKKPSDQEDLSRSGPRGQFLAVWACLVSSTLSLGITSLHAENRQHQVENKQVCVAMCACEGACVGSSPSIPSFAQAACGTH